MTFLLLTNLGLAWGPTGAAPKPKNLLLLGAG
jgi:hypothetical protein